MDFEVLKKRLIELGYEVSCFDTANQAVEYLDAQVDGKTVGCGGSMTITQMGLMDKLSTHNEVFWHHRLSAGETVQDACKKANSAQVYFSSVNGIATTGEIVNIDGTCNRVAGVFFGHEKVYLIVGKNKIAKNFEDALWRARNVASPKNAQRLGKNTPCAKNADRCYDCDSPDRICRGLSVLWVAPKGCKYEIVLIDQELGY